MAVSSDVVEAQAAHLRTTTYSAHGHLGMGPAAWREMFREQIDSRELTWRLFLRDFSARYRQTFLGYLWAVIPALVTTATFTWLNRSHVLPIAGTKLPYPVFVLLGMTVWQLFATGLTNCTQSLVNAGTLITKVNFPRETLVIAAFGQSVFEFLIRCVLVAAAFVLFHVEPRLTVLLVPIAMIPLCFLTLGLGFLFALANGVLRDVGQVVVFLLTFWMFLTPVVYPVSKIHSLLNVINPISPFAIAAQDLTTVGHLTQPANFAIGCLVSAVTFMVSWRVFHLTEPRIAERV